MVEEKSRGLGLERRSSTRLNESDVMDGPQMVSPAPLPLNGTYEPRTRRLQPPN